MENYNVTLTKDDVVPRTKKPTDNLDGAGYMPTGSSGQLTPTMMILF